MQSKRAQNKKKAPATRKPKAAANVKKPVPAAPSAIVPAVRKNNAGQPARKRNRAPTRLTDGHEGTGLSKPAELWLKALVNPFGTFSELPYVPMTTTVKSKRFRAFQRGMFATGATGTGFVMWCPLVPTNNQNAIWTTDASWAGGTNFTAGPATGVTASNKTSMEYANAAFSSSGNFLQARLVSSCMRIRCTTAPYRTQGMVMAVQVQTGGNVATVTAAALANSEDSVIVPTRAAEKDWLYWRFIPVDESDYSFNDDYVNYASSTANQPSIGFWVSGADTTTGCMFEYELVEYWEFMGETSTIVLDDVVDGYSDPVGGARVLETLAYMPRTLRLQEAISQAANSVVEAIAHSDSVAKTVEDLLGLAGIPLNVVGKLASSVIGMLTL